jgi:hypothetical protein
MYFCVRGVEVSDFESHVKGGLAFIKRVLINGVRRIRSCASTSAIRSPGWRGCIFTEAPCPGPLTGHSSDAASPSGLVGESRSLVKVKKLHVTLIASKKGWTREREG